MRFRMFGFEMKYIGCIPLLFLVLFSCKKQDSYEKQNPCGSTYGQTIPLSSDLSYFKYKIGTYWILQDSLSGTIDSMFVYSNTEGLENTTCGKEEYYTFLSSAGSFKLYYYSKIDNSCGWPVYGGGNDIRYDSLFIGTQYFYNVHVSRTTDCSSSNIKSYFMNADSGFIKIEIKDSNSQLLSNKILQRNNIVR